MNDEERLETAGESSAMATSCRSFPKTAWIVVGILVLISMILHGDPDHEAKREGLNAVQQRLLEIQGQYLVGASQVPGIQKAQLYENAKALNAGPLSARLRFVVLAGELMGADEADKQAEVVWRTIDHASLRSSDRERRVALVLRMLYSDYEDGHWDAPSLKTDDRRLLRDELGWFGALALSPDRSAATDPGETSGEDPARKVVIAAASRTFVIVILGSLCGLVLGLAATAGASLFLVLVVTKKIHSRIATGVADSAIYLETFAVWMLLFFATSLAAGWIVRQFPASRILVSSVASLLSLAAVSWPIVRGVPWSQVRRDIGWVPGGKPIRELFWGVICYISNLPILALGLLATLALFALYSAVAGTPGGLESVESAPTHPVVQWVRQAGWSGRLQIFVLACLVAPLVEETAFRGVFYRHIRESTRRWSTGVSIALSCGVTSFVFAVIHPQGLLAVPALMAVATGLSLTREWRGSLLAAIAMHAMNNGVMMLLLFSLV